MVRPATAGAMSVTVEAPVPTPKNDPRARSSLADISPPGPMDNAAPISWTATALLGLGAYFVGRGDCARRLPHANRRRVAHEADGHGSVVQCDRFGAARCIDRDDCPERRNLRNTKRIDFVADENHERAKEADPQSREAALATHCQFGALRTRGDDGFSFGTSSDSTASASKRSADATRVELIGERHRLDWARRSR